MKDRLSLVLVAATASTIALFSSALIGRAADPRAGRPPAAVAPSTAATGLPGPLLYSPNCCSSDAELFLPAGKYMVWVEGRAIIHGVDLVGGEGGYDVALDGCHVMITYHWRYGGDSPPSELWSLDGYRVVPPITQTNEVQIGTKMHRFFYTSIDLRLPFSPVVVDTPRPASSSTLKVNCVVRVPGTRFGAYGLVRLLALRLAG